MDREISLSNDSIEALQDRDLSLSSDGNGLSYSNRRPNESISLELSSGEPRLEEPHQLMFDPNPQYDRAKLQRRLKDFIDDRRNSSNQYFTEQIKDLCSVSSEINEMRGNNPLDLSYIVHSHYYFSYQEGKDFDPIELPRLSVKKEEFDILNFPRENIYNFIKNVVGFISRLMVKWGIFNINQYTYRFKGRSLTVKLLDMEKINDQCITLDMLWLSYAICHQPFVGKISEILPCFGKILQYHVNKVFSFIDRCKNQEDPEFNFDNISFDRANWSQKLFKRMRNHKLIEELHEILTGIELTYRNFEKRLIEELLIII